MNCLQNSNSDKHVKRVKAAKYQAGGLETEYTYWRHPMSISNKDSLSTVISPALDWLLDICLHRLVSLQQDGCKFPAILVSYNSEHCTHSQLKKCCTGKTGTIAASYFQERECIFSK